MSDELHQAVRILHYSRNTSRKEMSRYISVPGGIVMNLPPNYDQLVDKLLSIDDYDIGGKELATICSEIPNDGFDGKMFISDLLKRAAVNDIPADRRRTVYTALDKLHLDEGKGAADDNETKKYLLNIENTDVVVTDLMTSVWDKYFRGFSQALQDMPNYFQTRNTLEMRKNRDGTWMIPKVIKGKKQSLYHLRYNLKYSPDISEEAREAVKSARISL